VSYTGKVLDGPLEGKLWGPEPQGAVRIAVTKPNAPGVYGIALYHWNEALQGWRCRKIDWYTDEAAKAPL
jgi:hypothetical protein